MLRLMRALLVVAGVLGFGTALYDLGRPQLLFARQTATCSSGTCTCTVSNTNCFCTASGGTCSGGCGSGVAVGCQPA